jgi:hypothetical protein
LGRAMQEDLAADALHSPCDRIFLDIVQNRSPPLPSLTSWSMR